MDRSAASRDGVKFGFRNVSPAIGDSAIGSIPMIMAGIGNLTPKRRLGDGLPFTMVDGFGTEISVGRGCQVASGGLLG